MLEEALVLDAQGQPIQHKGRTHSQDWDEVQEFCRNVYMPYRAQPLSRGARPDATMLSAQAGRVTMTRFSYGTDVYLDQFDPDAGNILVLNTLRGNLAHQADEGEATTSAGESYVVDCSRTAYWLKADPAHMQLNLTIPHSAMEEIAAKWFGDIPGDGLWTRRVKFGGQGSRWLSLIDYAARRLCHDHMSPKTEALGRHLEELICLELLTEWAHGAGLDLNQLSRGAAPVYVRKAEEILRANLRNPPTIGDVAESVGVSGRTLSEGFRRFRGTTPRAFLQAQRLEGFRKALLAAEPERTVTEIATDWGYVNLGALAGTYRNRYGEKPSETRARAVRS